MKFSPTAHFAVIAALLLQSLGCGTIASGRHSDVTIVSNPPAAHVVIRDRNGNEVKSVETPAVVNLQRGYYMMPAQYTATVEAPGYEPKQVGIDYKLNPWLWGNLLLGIVGAPVGLIIDDSTGALWKPKQETIALNLTPVAGAGPADELAAPVAVSKQPVQSPNYTPTAMADNPAQQVGYQEPISRR